MHIYNGIDLGLRFEQGRTSANTAAVGGVFFVVLLIAQLIFAFVQFSTPAYVITNGMLLLVFLLCVYAIAKAKQ
ncbi:MAG: hypothetical protein J5701_08485 [Bacteroidales bacterium]|nr:hypothetical protein [Bacteroidales bacterium]